MAQTCRRGGRPGQSAQPFGSRDQAAVHAAGLYAGGESFFDDARLSRPTAEHARHLRHHAPRPHLDAAPADRPRARRRTTTSGCKTSWRMARTAVSLIPCNSVYRGYDTDEVPPELLGTCGVSRQHRRAHGRLPRRRRRSARSRARLNDPSPFTLLALMLAAAKRRGIDWQQITGTSNQCDYLSHFVANHMFFRLALPGARRVLTDHIAVCQRIAAALESDVGRRPAHAAGRRDAGRGDGVHARRSAAVRRGLHRARHGPRSSSCRASRSSSTSRSASSRRSPSSAPAGASGRGSRASGSARRTRKSWRFKFHGQTSGVDLTRQQPLNNIARVTAQAMAGIFGGLQSLHTDAYDEALSVPDARRRAHRHRDAEHPARGSASDRRDRSARRLVLRRDAHRRRWRRKILAVIARIDAAGGMYKAVEAGLVQRISGESALALPEKVESGEQTVVGVNKYRVPNEDRLEREALKPPPRRKYRGTAKASRSASRPRAARDSVRAGSRRSRRAAAEQATRTCSRQWWRPPAPVSRMARSAPRCARFTASASR